jgi:phage terminase small subunit
MAADLNAPSKAPKAGRSAVAAAERRQRFVERYLVNGNNAKEAAICAGISPASAKQAGCAMLKEPSVREALAARAKAVAEAAEMTSANWGRELSAVAFTDPADLFDADGKILAVDKMSPRIRAALASIKIKTDIDGGTTTEIKLWPKVEALNTMARHLGLFEKDNRQLAPNLSLVVELV